MLQDLFSVFNELVFRGLQKLLDSKNYLDASKVKPWLEGIVIKALNEFPRHGGEYVITVPIGTFYVFICRYLILIY